MEVTDQGLLADIQAHGWHTIVVPGEEDLPAFAYSIGLYHSFGHPEVVVFGLDLHCLHDLLETLGERVRAGAHLDSQHDAEELEGRRWLFRPVARKWYTPYFGCARWFYHHSDFPVLQALWPDERGVYPGQEDCDPRCRSRQPLLQSARAPDWPFDDLPNVAVITTRRVLDDGHPILLVAHDEDDGAWQFLDGGEVRLADAMLVSLRQIVERDPSLRQLADLPPGWQAWRLSAAGPWQRGPQDEP